MKITKNEILELIGVYPLLSKKDIAVYSNCSEKTIQRLLKDQEINSIVFSVAGTQEKCYFFSKDINKINSIRQLHHRLVAKAVAYLVTFLNKQTDYEIYSVEKEVALVADSESQSDLVVKLIHKKNNSKIFLLVEIETGLKSKASSMIKFDKIKEIQEEAENEVTENEQVYTLVLQNSNFVENSNLFLLELLTQYKKGKGELGENIFFNSFDFDTRAIYDTYRILEVDEEIGVYSSDLRRLF